MARPKTPVEREWESPRESAEATGTSVPMIYAALGRGDIGGAQDGHPDADPCRLPPRLLRQSPARKDQHDHR